jgi:hypothetical protein
MHRVGHSPGNLLSLSLIVLVFASITSQLEAVTFPLRWRWSNPTPHGANIIDMAFKDGLAVQVAERGQIFTSDDLLFWTPRESGTTSALRAVTFFNNRIVITGENGTVVYGDSVEAFNVVNLGTADWLEGVAASPTLLVAVGDNGAIYTSADGANWQRRAVSFSNWLRSVAYGSTAGRFVAVGEGGLVAVSSNGTSWQRLTTSIPSTTDLNKVAWINNQFLLVGSGGKNYFSDSGLLWFSLGANVTNDLFAVTGQNGARLMAGDSQLLLSEPRAAWSNELDPSKTAPAPAWTYLSAIWTGDSYWVGGRTGMLVEGFKTNSTSSPTFWLPYSDTLRNWLWDLRRFNGLYITVGDFATILTSSDGVNWSIELIPSSATNTTFLGVGGFTNLAVAVGSAGSILLSPDEQRQVTSTNASGTITTNMVSTLGVIWNAVEPRPTTNDLQGVTAWNDLLVASGGNGTILTSLNGSNWVQRTTPTTRFLSSVTGFRGGLVAVGDDGTVLTSPDGNAWTLRNANTLDWIFRVRNFNDQLVAVGQNGAILTSIDGVNWTRRISGTTSWLNDIARIDQTWFVVGNQGTILTSPDLITWTSRGTITEKSIYTAETNPNGQLIVAGIEGIILRSQIVPRSDPIFVQYTYGKSSANVTTNRFLFSGLPDQRFTLERSRDLNAWTGIRSYDLLDGGSVLLYEEEVLNAPPWEFFRAKIQP